jgi:hypothetical protein
MQVDMVGMEEVQKVELVVQLLGRVMVLERMVEVLLLLLLWMI